MYWLFGSHFPTKDLNCTISNYLIYIQICLCSRNKTLNTIADQSYSERQLFEKAYDRLQSEFEVVLQISQVDVKKKMDKALGRNQNLEE